MGLFDIAFLALAAFSCGVICTLIVQFILFKKYLESGTQATPPKFPIPPSQPVLPEELINQIKDAKAASVCGGSPRQSLSQGSENLAINLALQFLFNELRNAERVRLWLYRKLNNEFKELVNQSTTGKLFDSVQLRDLNLGNQFPVIKGLEVCEAKVCPDTGLLETLDLCLDLHYSGNFQMSIDVKMLLSKTAYLSLQLKRVTGKARLQFTRVPYTHWSLSFYTDPILELDVQSQFQGRQLQPQIISLITGQIRRAVRRKHTLPRYKVRYKPFFRRLNDEDIDLSEFSSLSCSGQLDVTLLEVSRLNIDSSWIDPENLSQIEIHCTLSVDATPWVCLTQYGGIPYMVLDLIISKVSSQQLGVVFKQEQVAEIGQNCVLVETIVNGSPAAIAEMKKGDVVVAVNGKKVLNMNQIGKLIKSAAQRRFIIRVERRYTSADWERSSLCRAEQERKKVSAKPETGTGTTLNVEDKNTTIKFSDLKDMDAAEIATEKATLSADAGNKLFKRRKSSAATHEESTTAVTAAAASPAAPAASHQGHERRTSNTSSSSSSTNASGSQCTIAASTVVEPPALAFSLNDLYYTTKEMSCASLVKFDETRTFLVDSEQQYLNIGVWGRQRGAPEGQQRLLGYINAPMKLIITQCSSSTTGHYLKWLSLLPPDSASPALSTFKLHGYSGFDPSLCFGDILLSYVWTPNRPAQNVVDFAGKKATEEVVKLHQPILAEDASKQKPHDFIRTHFHRATHCDFCTKKIWLKDAVQCRDCGMVCHKKCEARCQAASSCGAEAIAQIAFEADECGSEPSISSESGPEISLTGCEEQVQGMSTSSMTNVRASLASTLLGLKKAGSTSSLTVPASPQHQIQQQQQQHQQIGQQTQQHLLANTRSLPPSPSASRKSSLIGGSLGINPDLLEGADPSVSAPLIAGNLDDCLMTKAKDSGKSLYKHLEPRQRIDKINDMITRLKVSLDAETTTRHRLYDNYDLDSEKRVSQIDLRIQALSVLLLHYCTGLQHAQEQLERPI
ncbi:hypothetical protein TKK_0017927 [Trichogramma kaykai]|uniref:PDZ domain-containing protein 8 n=1 Tax=Trichogramma kaykai TaxID=54128 RepID=A0ABD2W0X7_9HYME